MLRGRPRPEHRGNPWAEHEFAGFGNTERSGGIELSSHRIVFVPPALNIQPRSDVDLALNQSVSITVALVPGLLAPYSVTIVPDQTRVSVNGAPAGQAVTTNLPNNAAGTFRLTGVSPGAYIVRVRARGVQCAAMGGRVH
jgi:hypothetical protein